LLIVALLLLIVTPIVYDVMSLSRNFVKKVGNQVFLLDYDANRRKKMVCIFFKNRKSKMAAKIQNGRLHLINKASVNGKGIKFMI
jgi:hypothetical protein